MSSSKLSNLSWAELRDRARRIRRRWSSEESPTVQAETVTRIADGERPPTPAEADEAVEVTVGGSDTEPAMKEKGGDIASSWAIQEPSWGIRSPVAKGEGAPRSPAVPVAATKVRKAELGTDATGTGMQLLAASGLVSNGMERKSRRPESRSTSNRQQEFVTAKIGSKMVREATKKEDDSLLHENPRAVIRVVEQQRQQRVGRATLEFLGRTDRRGGLARTGPRLRTHRQAEGLNDEDGPHISPMESLLHSVGLNMKKVGFMGLDEHSDTYFVDFGKGGAQSLGYGYDASHVDKEEFV
ncbi:unnamed protein product [Linum trigynum]|uniref:Uncharacterized protein n=1 Tax=Linum trigynum TaxID=586398 RepID=A0AAV2G042_9ROSI